VSTTDKRIIPRGRLVADLYGLHRGRPVVVVGGGPSAPEQLTKLRLKDPVWVFANDHGFKLGLRPHYIFAKDHRHLETKEFMEDRLRAHGRHLIVTQHYWGDYRAGNWPSQGNSGQLAIAFAALLGGSPIVPIGIDCYQSGTYFHDALAPNVSLGRMEATWKSSMTRMKLRLEGAVIRPAGGLMTSTFQRYTPDEVLPAARVPDIFAAYKTTPTYYLRAVKTFQVPNTGKCDVPPGWMMPVTAKEYELFARNGWAVPVDIHSSAVISSSFK
jgi:hypothetical protein